MIKLAKLPDRTPVRISLSLSPSLHDRLARYASVYAETYGVEEPLSELIPAILDNFLVSDRQAQRVTARQKSSAQVRKARPNETA
jgi:hypothetical protein